MPVVLDGTLNLTTELNGTATLLTSIDGTVSATTLLNGQLGVFIEVYNGEYDTYTGEYVVIPTTSEQTLETQDKVMRNDVTVKEVPYFETSNDSGGNTVYIASNVGG